MHHDSKCPRNGEKLHFPPEYNIWNKLHNLHHIWRKYLNNEFVMQIFFSAEYSVNVQVSGANFPT